MLTELKIEDFLHRKKVPVKVLPDEEYSLVTVKLYHKGVILREKKKGSLLGSKMYRVSAGDFILSGIDARNGAFGIVPEELDGAIVTNDFWYFDVDESKVKRDFFYWLTTTPLFLDACQKSSKGETQRIRLQKKLFNEFVFHFPPIEEQDSFLQSFGSIDKFLSSLKMEIFNQSSYLTKLRQAILQEAIEGKLTADWRKENPVRKGDPDYDAEALLEKIQSEKAKLIKERKIKKQKPLAPIKADEVPFKLPNGWVWSRLGEVGFVNPRNYIDDNLDVSFIPMPCISAKFGITPHFKIRKWSEVKSSFTHFAENDVAIAKITPCFENSKAAVFKKLKNKFGAGTTELHVLRPVIVLSDYIYINVKTTTFLNDGSKLMTGAVGQKRVPVDYFSNSIIPLPSLAEQQAIVERVEKLLSMVDELDKQVSERKEQSEQLMQAVLREAFEGGK